VKARHARTLANANQIMFWIMVIANAMVILENTVKYMVSLQFLPMDF